MYFSWTPDLDLEQYFNVNLLGGSIEYDVNVDQAECGCILALYATTMPAVNDQ